MTILDTLRAWRTTHRVRTPTVLQMEVTECGAASLGIVLGYHGRPTSLEELRVACGVSRDGSKASNVLKAARRYGLKAKGYRLEPTDLREYPLPQIVFWNFNHFLVVEGFGPERVYLNDPATGPRTVSAEEFDEAFTGVTLVLEPGETFEAGAGAQRSLLAALQARVRGSQRALLFVALAGLALVVPGLVVPAFTRVFVDFVLVGGLLGWMGPLLLGMALTLLVLAALTWLQRRALLRLETRLALGMSSRFLWHVLRLPVGFYSQRFAGDIAFRVGLNDRVAQMLSGELATTLLNVVLIVFFAALMLRYDPVLTTIGVLLAGLNLLALRAVARRRVDANLRLTQERGKLYSTAMGGLQMIETLKATASEGDFFAKWSGYQAKLLNAQQQFGLATQVLAVVPPLLTALVTVAILVVGGMRVVGGALSIGMLVAFQVLMFSFLQPVNQLVNLGGRLQEVEADLNRLDDVLRHPTDRMLDPDRSTPQTDSNGSAKLTGHIELRDVSFGYNPLEPPLIEGFNLTLTPGSRVALVGGSGSGKSTIARLVVGLFEPWSGEILFDGQPREAIPHETLTNSLALVDQDIFLFEGNVRDNLTLWDQTLPEAALLQAAHDASIHEDIADRPGTYDATVIEGGANFSGGQRQRLEIARALAGNPTIVVLDEATSALDPMTEKEIDDKLRRRGCTCLIVAHRLSTIRDADEIIVLDQGKVVERGTHEALWRAGGAYAALISME